MRAVETDTEREAFFRLASTQFMRDVPTAIGTADFRRFVQNAPPVEAAAMRGAFAGDDYLGGYLIEERMLGIAAARLRTGCIGVVVVDSARRGQGIGRALMHDALAHARARGHVLTLLHGLADYYRPFGYADVFDPTNHAIARAAILALPESRYQVRQATVDDAPALLGLYDRHYGRHPGYAERSLERQQYLIEFGASLEQGAYRLRDGSPYLPAVVAVDASDHPRGYLAAPWGPLRAFGSEVAADDWMATLALLRHDAHHAGRAQEPDTQVHWPLPPDSLVAALLADHLVVERFATSRPWAGWQAALINPRDLIHAMLPVWNARWQQCSAGWSGTLGLVIDGVTGVLRLGAAGAFLGLDAPASDTVVLTGQVVMPLIFGFRSVAWAAQQAGQSIPPGLLPILEVLFPPVTPWIAPTNGC